MKPNSVRLAFVINDIHCGSTLGLLPPGCVTLEGTELGLNLVQKWLYSCWGEATEVWMPTIAADDPYALIWDGDLIEGVHHGTKQIVSVDPADHLTIAQSVCVPVSKKAKHVFMVDGTEVHTGTSSERTLGKLCNAHIDPSSGRYAFEKLVLTIAGTRCVFKHHIPTTSREWLDNNALAQELANEQLAAVRNDEELPRVVCCAHRHRFGYVQNTSGMCVVGAPWQMLTRHGHKVASSARTTPGIYALDWRNKADGELPELHSIMFKPPHTKRGITI